MDYWKLEILQVTIVYWLMVYEFIGFSFTLFNLVKQVLSVV
uniref:Uncharacterized protein n=1 Tax=Rhizophora mucronata TaxID=61149 RepID=A0A2P2J348_RHIMU